MLPTLRAGGWRRKSLLLARPISSASTLGRVRNAAILRFRRLLVRRNLKTLCVFQFVKNLTALNECASSAALGLALLRVVFVGVFPTILLRSRLFH